MSDFPLQIYNPSLPTRVSYRHLPHWEQDGVCAFVTMRLNDSTPIKLHQQYERAKSFWLKKKGLSGDETWSELSHKLPPLDYQRFQRFASKQYQAALDKGLGSCLFKHPKNRKPLIDILHRKDQDHYLLADYVIMPNHVHLLIQPQTGRRLLSILSSIRRLSAREINPLIHRTGTLWHPEPFDHLVRSRHFFNRYRQYIALNPSRAQLPRHNYAHWTC